jgi:predicted DsbA family dithiol-disulfide isomerase
VALDVDIWSDVTCPWCAAGKRSLDEALAVFEHRDDVQVTWHAFELDPGAPRDRERGGNTFDAHRLVKHAAAHGRETALMERLMQAHADGEPVGDREALVRMAGEVGLEAGPARIALASGRHAAAVREDERLAAKLGITAVPYFVLARRYGVAGAQAAPEMLEALHRAWAG